MLQNAYLLAKIGADTAETEQHFADILPKIGGSLSIVSTKVGAAWWLVSSRASVECSSSGRAVGRRRMVKAGSPVAIPAGSGE